MFIFDFNAYISILFKLISNEQYISILPTLNIHFSFPKFKTQIKQTSRSNTPQTAY